jgi:hypothetical protein
MMGLLVGLLFIGVAVISHLSARAMCESDPERDYWRLMLGGWLFGRLANGWPTWLVLLLWIAASVSAIGWAIEKRG